MSVKMFLSYFLLGIALLIILILITYDFKGREKVSSTQYILHQLQKSLQEYKTACGKYPDTNEGLKELLPNETKCQNYVKLASPDVTLLTINKFLDKWGKPFEYSSDGSRFSLRSISIDHSVITDQEK